VKISAVEAVPLGIPWQPTDPPSPWTARLGKQVLVRVATDEGLVGWGEAFALGAPTAVCAVVDEALGPLLLGEPPTDIERLVDRLHRATLLFGRRGLGMFAISGVELRLGPRRADARRAGVRAAGGWSSLGSRRTRDWRGSTGPPTWPGPPPRPSRRGSAA
jgi:hypothetical protein